AKSRDIPVGPGRGSGAGSLAAYCVGITDIDPIRYNLIFKVLLIFHAIRCTEVRQFCIAKRKFKVAFFCNLISVF
ncbi:hypothetical protein, partial [Gemmiger formicilis]|uniref:hypothetical protein n=1 Tax=Gemmiger formicilis TaxID=745368 RepID=UPI001FB03D2A